MAHRFAYVSNGSLHLKTDERPVREVESQFGQTLRRRALEINRRHAWKEMGRGAQFMRGGNPWARQESDAAEVHVALSGATAAKGGDELIYSLETNDVTGIFVLTDQCRNERRLFHSADYRVGQVSAHPDGARLTFALLDRVGSSIGVINTDGTGWAEVTQGDSIDLAPRWVPGANALVFQTAGVGRDEKGGYRGRGPFAVHRLELDSGDMTTLADEETFDFLSPQVTSDGALYYIRRPYEKERGRLPLWRMLLDLLLFPFHLIFAVFQYLNLFSMMYAGKPLTNAGDVRQRHADVRNMMMWSNLENAQEAIKRSRSKQESPGLVPDTWELVKQDGGKQVLARGVLAFDIAPDGSILYTNGSAIFSLDATGRTERLHKATLIERVIALPA